MNPLDLADWLALLGHFAAVSLLAVGGAITVAPDLHRVLVDSSHWLSDAQFNTSIAIAQATPGPNALFVGLIGWHIGLNAGSGPAAGWTAQALALAGFTVAQLAFLLPSGVLTYFATRWAHRHRQWLAVRAFKVGMAPLVVGLVLATGWLLAALYDEPARDWRLWLLIALVTLLVWRTRVHLLWLIGAGAVLGAAGLI